MDSEGLKQFGQELAKIGGRGTSNDILRAFLNMHRTHQQSFMRAIYQLAEDFAELPQSQVTDQRNLQAHGFCVGITKEKYYFPYV